MAGMTRRELFRGTFKAEQRVTATAQGEPSTQPKRKSPSHTELEAIAGDFPPEMLSMEAQRLGLDPDSPDRETLLAAVYEAMAGSGPGTSG